MRVNHSGSNVAMSQKLLNCPDIVIRSGSGGMLPYRRFLKILNETVQKLVKPADTLYLHMFILGMLTVVSFGTPDNTGNVELGQVKRASLAPWAMSVRVWGACSSRRSR